MPRFVLFLCVQKPHLSALAEKYSIKTGAKPFIGAHERSWSKVGPFVALSEVR
jgi:hypothetical protein